MNSILRQEIAGRFPNWSPGSHTQSFHTYLIPKGAKGLGLEMLPYSCLMAAPVLSTIKMEENLSSSLILSEVWLEQANPWIIPISKLKSVFHLDPKKILKQNDYFFPVEPPPDHLSRAWAKACFFHMGIKERLQKDDTIIELGVAPGGMAQYWLGLNLNLKIIGVDKAKVKIPDHSDYQHFSMTYQDFFKDNMQPCDWLVSDLNLDPISFLKTLLLNKQKLRLVKKGYLFHLKILQSTSINLLIEKIAEFSGRLHSFNVRVCHSHVHGQEWVLIASKKES
jgi:hypothetical protein